MTCERCVHHSCCVAVQVQYAMLLNNTSALFAQILRGPCEEGLPIRTDRLVYKTTTFSLVNLSGCGLSVVVLNTNNCKPHTT